MIKPKMEPIEEGILNSTWVLEQNGTHNHQLNSVPPGFHQVRDGGEFGSSEFNEESQIYDSNFVNGTQNHQLNSVPHRFHQVREGDGFSSSEFNRVSQTYDSNFVNEAQNHAQHHSVPGSLAIVLAPEQNQLTGTGVVDRAYKKRSSELVRVFHDTDKDEKISRKIVRSTRMIFDSLRVFASFDIENREGLGFGPGPRVDLKAAKMMNQRGLRLNQEKRIVGAIPGVYIGDVFLFRVELCLTGLHRQTQAGIDFVTAKESPTGEPIATSIVVSGGYEDDQDVGEVITYTGQGGQDKYFRQCSDQRLEGGNLGLERSMQYGIEVRVIRGFNYDGSVSGKVYVYDGLYSVVSTRFDRGRSGFGVYKFQLIRIPNQHQMGSSILRFAKALGGYVSFDISMGKETIPVDLFSDIDGENQPLGFEYLKTTVFPPCAYQTNETRKGCNCVTGCSSDCSCAHRNGGKFAYNLHGILVRGKPLIYECGPCCECPPNCRNRVTQHGLTKRLQIFRSKETGWGVRSLDLVQAGSFICEYAGVVLTREQAQILSMNGDNLVYPNRFAERWTEWGDLSSVISDYVKPELPSITQLDFAMDVSKMRNVGCYITHNTSPNVFVQLVHYDHDDIRFPRLMLFAMENIPPLRELSLDYGALKPMNGA